MASRSSEIRRSDPLPNICFDQLISGGNILLNGFDNYSKSYLRSYKGEQNTFQPINGNLTLKQS